MAESLDIGTVINKKMIAASHIYQMMLDADVSNVKCLTFANARQEYVNVISRHQVIQKDKNGKAWMIMGVMDIAPDQTPMERIRRTVINRKTGEILPSAVVPANQQLTKREKEILLLIRQGFLSKEIAYKLNLSIYIRELLARYRDGRTAPAQSAGQQFCVL